MSEFLDQEVEESDRESTDSNNSSDDEPKIKKRKVTKKEKKKKSNRRVVGSSDEDEDDDDEEGAEELKDFIADEEEEEPDDDKSEKSEKNDDYEEELEDDDLDLINENLDNVKVDRKPRIIQPDDSDEEILDDRTAIQRKLFDDRDDDGEGPSSAHGRSDEMSERGSESDEEHSEDNFIVDGDRPKHRHHQSRKYGNMPEGALDDARDVFGVEDFNFEDFFDEDEEQLEDEEDELIEDDGEGGETRIRRVRAPRDKKSTLLDTMEPSELDRGYLSAYDKKIMLEDRPERFQLRRTPVTTGEDSELDLESKWIYQYAFSPNNVSSQAPNELESRSHESVATDKIKETLKFIRNQLFEVPFIAFYRKEHINSVLTMNELWRVYEYDEKWCHLQTRKNKLLELMKRMQTYHLETESMHRRQITESDFNDVFGIDSSESLSDASAQFQLYYGIDIAKMQEWEKIKQAEAEDDETAGMTRFKQSSRNDKYQMCVENGIGGMAARFGLTARQFAENIDWKRHDVQQDEVSPRVAAEEYITTSFSSVDAVISGAVFMMAKEISRQPLVREKVRTLYRPRVVLSAYPTKQGRHQIEESHPIYSKRYIKEKVIHEIEHEEYLHYTLQKKAGNMEVILTCDTDIQKERKDTLLVAVMREQPFRRDEFSDIVEEWNFLRDEVVRMAVEEMLIPCFEAEIHEKLLEEAREAVIKKCTMWLYNRLAIATYHPSEEELEDDEEEVTRHGEVRVMGVAYATDYAEASFGAMIDQNGAVVDYCRLVHLTKKGGFGTHAHLKNDTMNMFKKFVERRRPHVIVLAGENMDAHRLKQDLESALRTLQNDGKLNKIPEVHIIDNEAAKVYMHSKTAMMEHADYPPTLRQAVSLARLFEDPLQEYAHLWNPDEDIFCLALHPLQKEVNKDDLTNALARELINRVNEVGVDVNRCLEHPHTASILQFVCGLGPRKSAHLLKILKQQDNLLGSRTQLVTLCKMGTKVFMNCAGFIKIDTNKVSDKTDAYVEVLDGSRVHPETYEWARKMAVDALEVDDSADPTAALEEILQAPERLKDLDLDAFADELNRQGFGEKKATLYDIQNELNSRYADMRHPFRPLSNEELFALLTKESSSSFAENKRVCGVVVSVQYKRIPEEQREQFREGGAAIANLDQIDGNWVCPFCHLAVSSELDVFYRHLNDDSRNGGCPGIPTGIKIRFDNGVMGFVPNKLISDTPNSFKNPLQRVKLNNPVYCRIVKMEPDRFSCLCSCRSSDLKREDDRDERPNYYDIAREEHDNELDKAEKEAKKTTTVMMKRVISHPNFHNVTYRDAARQLAKLEQGDAIIRPSSKSNNHLTVTWKVAENVVQNIDIEEHGKEQPFMLGKKLTIEMEEYDDLEEILSRHIQPMAASAREITQHKYYVDRMVAEDKDQIDSKLYDDKRMAPSRIPYTLTVARTLPGKFCLSYLARTKPRHEYMTVTPDGIRFRQQMFATLDQLLSWFKIHFRDPPPQQNYAAYRR